MWKCKPAKWLYGLPLLALLLLAVFFYQRRSIEADLTQRVNAALEDAGFDWARAEFSGRDGVLTGRANGVREQDEAIAVAERVRGVRIISEDMDVVRTASPYIWSAQKEENEIVLSGFVPGRKDRKAVLTMAKAQFPKMKIIDEMEIASGEADHRTFMETVGFGLKQLSLFNYGRVGLRDRSFSIEGLTKDEKGFKRLQTALRDELPIDMRLATNRVRAPEKVIPRVSPFLWMASKKGKTLRLKGHVHSAREKADILAEARQLMPKYRIIDNMEIARGDPSERQWEKATGAALSQLAKLENGSVTLSDFDYSIKGHAANSSDYKEVDKALSELPRGFRVAQKELTLPRIDPYIWRADYHAGRLTLSGHVPDKKTARTIKAQAKRAFRGAYILDKMEVGPGAPAKWDRVTRSALSQLSRLENGSAMVWNTEIEMRGRATSAERRTDIEERMKDEIPSGYQFFDEIKVPEPEPVERPGPEIYEPEVKVMQYDDEALAADTPLQRDDCQSYLDSILAGQRIHFATASAKIEKDSFAVLDRLTHTARRCPDARIEVQGHTDSDGSRKFNEFLSLRRARAVVKYLIDNGIAKDRLSAIGYGEAKPIVPNTSAENKAKNRRIEFKVRDF